MAQNSKATVGVVFSKNLPLWYLDKIEVFPTEVSPTSITKNYVSFWLIKVLKYYINEKFYYF